MNDILFKGANIRSKVARLVILFTFIAVICAPLFSVSTPFPYVTEKPDESSDESSVNKLNEDIGSDVNESYLSDPAQSPQESYFDPDDFGITKYSRDEYALINRGTDIDSEDLLFGQVDESDFIENYEIPPDMTFRDDETTVYVHLGTLNMRSLPTSKSEIIHTFRLGDSFLRTGIGAKWSKIIDSEGRTGYVFNEYIRTAKPTPTPTPKPKYTSPAKANTLGEAIAMEAQRYLGVKYVWAKADPKIGFDCSGLTWYVFKRYGIDTPRGTATYKNAGTIVPYSQIAPGDVISWDVWKDGSSIDHVGIYIGNGKMVHASSNRRNRAVVVANVKEYTNSARIVQIHRFYKN